MESVKLYYYAMYIAIHRTRINSRRLRVLLMLLV